MEPTYTPTEDVYETLKDGTGRVLVARAGVPIAWRLAYDLGLVKTEAPQYRVGVVDGFSKSDPQQAQEGAARLRTALEKHRGR